MVIVGAVCAKQNNDSDLLKDPAVAEQSAYLYGVFGRETHAKIVRKKIQMFCAFFEKNYCNLWKHHIY